MHTKCTCALAALYWHIYELILMNAVRLFQLSEQTAAVKVKPLTNTMLQNKALFRLQ